MEEVRFLGGCKKMWNCLLLGNSYNYEMIASRLEFSLYNGESIWKKTFEARTYTFWTKYF